jgi:hypothetical protein
MNVQEEIDAFDKPQCLIFKCHLSKCLTDMNNKHTQTVIKVMQKSSKNLFYQISRFRQVVSLNCCSQSMELTGYWSSTG